MVSTYVFKSSVMKAPSSDRLGIIMEKLRYIYDPFNVRVSDRHVVLVVCLCSLWLVIM